MGALLRRLVPLAAAGLLAVPAAAAGASSFQTPKGAAFCTLATGSGPSRLVCWMPADGYVIAMGARSGRPRGHTNLGNNGYSRAVRTLAFGRAWRAGPYRCVSARRGLTCTNARGHGWLMRRYHGVRSF